MERTIQSLNGAWGYEANGVGMPPVCVPFSARCVGDSACIRTFDTKSAPRAELCFEGITYEARVTLNGAELGVMRAYSLYSFDVTGLLRPEGNELRRGYESETRWTRSPLTALTRKAAAANNETAR
jgi:hypothetical protein